MGISNQLLSPNCKTILLIDKHVTFKAMTVNNVNKAIALMKTYRYILLHRGLNMDVKILLYKSILMPILLHGAVIWANATARHIKNLQVQQNKCLRIILEVDMRTPILQLHQATGIPLVEEYVERVADRFYNKTMTHDNPLIRGITHTRQIETRHRLRYQPFQLYGTPRR